MIFLQYLWNAPTIKKIVNWQQINAIRIQQPYGGSASGQTCKNTLKDIDR